MALKGSIVTNSYNGRYYTLSWTATQSVANNTSTFAWTLSCAGGDANWYAERALKAVIAGKTVKNKTSRVERRAGVIDSGSFTVTHSSTGTYSFSASLQVACYTSTVNLTAEGDFTLNTILRYAKVTTAPNFNDEANPVIEYSNPAGSKVTTLQAGILDTTGKVIYAAYRDISKSGTSYTFPLTESERELLRNACTAAKSMKVRFYIKTVISGTTFTHYLEKTLSIVNAEPLLTVSAKDVNAASLALTGSEETMIKGYNSILAEAAVTGQKGATIQSYKITNGGNTMTTQSGTFSNAESAAFVFSVTDSRGNTTEETVTLSLIEYVKLTCDLNGKAPDAEGNLSFTITGNCFAGSFGEVENTVHVCMRYKENGGEYSEWTPMDVTIGSNTYEADVSLSGLNYQSRYTFQAKAEDGLMAVESGEKAVKTIPVFHWGENDFVFNVMVLFQNDIRALDAKGNEFSLLQKVLEQEAALKTLTQS